MKLFNKDHTPSQTKVVVAMSGGVDSSVAAALTHEAGYDVIGITLQLYDHGLAVGKKGACCAGQDIYDAQKVAEAIGFPHYVLDYEHTFKQEVMDDFVSSYLHGKTPVPCIRCNQKVKFKDLVTTAQNLGAQALITGHYVRRLGADDQAVLYRAKDLDKDQSYFMFATTQEQLNFLRFPLGDMEKSTVRRQAHRLDLQVADKPDSQDICFVPDGKYSSVIERLRPGAGDPGQIVDTQGRVLGQHNGIIHFTVGQRKGIGIGGGEALYVVHLDHETRQVVVGPKQMLACSEIWLEELNFLIPLEQLSASLNLQVKYRSSQEPVPAKAAFCEQGSLLVSFSKPQYGVSPGQACVFYEEDRVLGGGWISHAVKNQDFFSSSTR